MRKIIFAIFLLIAAADLSAQTTESTSPLSKDYYLQKSKKQKKAAWIVTGSSITLFFVTALAIAVTPPQPTYGSDEVESEGNIPAAIALAGIATGGYLFFAAAKNKKRARQASVFLNIQKLPAHHQAVRKVGSYPAIGVNIVL